MLKKGKLDCTLLNTYRGFLGTLQSQNCPKIAHWTILLNFQDIFMYKPIYYVCLKVLLSKRTFGVQDCMKIIKILILNIYYDCFFTTLLHHPLKKLSIRKHLPSFWVWCMLTSCRALHNTKKKFS